MLTRSSQVGEFYIMGPPPNQPPPNTKGFMDILIYDEEADRHVRITWGEAIDATMLQNDGEIHANNATPLWATEDGFGTKAEWWTEAQKWNTANKSGTKTDLDAAYAGKPIYIVIARPFIEHLMHSAVIAVGGKDTGATLFGPADMQISANTQVKTIEVSGAAALTNAFLMRILNSYFPKGILRCVGQGSWGCGLCHTYCPVWCKGVWLSS